MKTPPATPLLNDTAFLQRLLAASPDCIKVLDLDANLLAMNENGQRALEIAELTPHLGTCWVGWWTGANNDAAEAAVAIANAGGTGRFEAGEKTFAGTPKWWDVTVTAVNGPDGRPERLLAVSRDMTAQRVARDSAAERLDRLRSVIESAKDYAVISIDAHGTIDGWSSGAADTFGWTEADAVGQPFDLIWRAQDIAGGSPGKELRLAEVTGVAPDNRWHDRKDARPIFVVGATRPIRDAGGTLVGFVKVCRDQTEREAMAKELADTKLRLDAALDGGRIATWVWDVRGDRFHADRNMTALFALPPDAAGGLPGSAYAASVFADDRSAVTAALRHAIDTGEDYVAEYRVGKFDPPRWAYARARVERDEHGTPIRLAGVVLDITDRKTAEAEKRLSDERSRQLADAMPQIVFAATPAGEVDYYNQRWYDYTGLPAGRTGGEGWDQVLRSEDFDRIISTWTESLRTGKPYEIEYEFRRASDGAYRWHLGRAVPIRNERGEIVRWFGTNTDIHDQKRVQAERDRLAEQRRLALHAANLGAWHIDTETGDVIFDEAFMKLFGVTGRRLPYTQLIESIHSDDRGRVDKAVRAATRLEDPQPYSTEYRVVHADQSVRWVHATGKVYHEGEGPARRYASFVGTVADITARKQADAERQAVFEREQAARAEAEAAGRMKDDFLATLSHELRTPLNAIVGWTQILKTCGPHSDDVTDGLNVIDRNARAQTQIIEDILDMSRIVSGKLHLDVRPVDLVGLVQAGVQTVMPAADAKNVQIGVLLDPNAGPISGDPNRLHQVFWNLMSNAVKFTPRGGRVQVRLQRVNSQVEISVADTGEGIAAAFLPHVFDRFRQADASTTRRHGGLGLGLAIVKQLVDLHGGSVQVRSPGAGQGTTFSVLLPMTAVQLPAEVPMAGRERPTAEVSDEARRTACSQLHGVDVVVVDDEVDASAMIKRLLEDCGAKVRTANSADDALALIRDRTPAVLVSDIGMPVQDGYALIRKVRATPGGAEVRALALTAFARASDRVRALEAGFNMHLSKPVEPVELVVSVAALACK